MSVGERLCGCSQDKRGESGLCSHIASLVFGYLGGVFGSPRRNWQSDERGYFETGDAFFKVANTEKEPTFVSPARLSAQVWRNILRALKTDDGHSRSKAAKAFIKMSTATFKTETSMLKVKSLEAVRGAGALEKEKLQKERKIAPNS